MKFRINKRTKLYKKITELNEKIAAANLAGYEFAQKYTGKKVVSVLWGNWPLIIGGGVVAIKMDKAPITKEWVHLKTDDDGEKFFTPNPKTKNGRKILKEMKELPFVGYEELNNLLNFDWREHGKKLTFAIPAYYIYDDCILINMPSFVEADKYKPPVGMVEITEKMFNEIKNKHESKNNQHKA
jgi:hypothetical protein